MGCSALAPQPGGKGSVRYRFITHHASFKDQTPYSSQQEYMVATAYPDLVEVK